MLDVNAIFGYEEEGNNIPLPEYLVTETYQEFGWLSETDFLQLKESILEAGEVIYPLVIDQDGHVIDGHNRLRAWRELVREGHDITRPFARVINPESPTEARYLVRLLNSVRRQLSLDERRSVIKAQLKDTPEWNNTKIARAGGVTGRLVERMRIELEDKGEIPVLDMLVDERGIKNPRWRPNAKTSVTKKQMAQTSSRAVAREKRVATEHVSTVAKAVNNRVASHLHKISEDVGKVSARDAARANTADEALSLARAHRETIGWLSRYIKNCERIAETKRREI